MAAPEVTNERIEACLDALELNYDTENGYVYVGFGRLICIFSAEHPMLVLDGMWAPILTEEKDVADLVGFAHTLNDRMMTPRTVVQQLEDSRARVVFGASVPIVEGMTDEQLKNAVVVALESMSSAAIELDETFPHLVPAEEN
ncbi:MAG: YbjN domain-containing protein [Propionibacteriaceae bacterium]|nr:YbjN domain-containing protein [Propionibacteriaceae bacterium]